MDSAGDVPQLDEAPVEPARRSSRPAAWSSYVSVDRDELASDAVTLLLPGEACGAAAGVRIRRGVRRARPSPGRRLLKLGVGKRAAVVTCNAEREAGGSRATYKSQVRRLMGYDHTGGGF